MYIAELFVRADSPWESFGHFYMSQEFIKLTPEDTHTIQQKDWYDTLKYIEDTNTSLEFFRILKKYNIHEDGDYLFKDSEVYENFELNLEETKNNTLKCKKFIEQAIFEAEESKVLAYVSIYELEDTSKIPINKQAHFHDLLREEEAL